MTPYTASMDGLSKSFPWAEGVDALDATRKGLNVLQDGFHFPLLVLKDSALTHNINTMAAWCRAHDFLLAPHGKTTMCPCIFKRQLDAGAWAITVANVSQAMVCAHFGVKRIVVANQIVGVASLRSLASMMNAHPDLACYCLADSPAAVAHMAAHLREAGAQRPVGVLIEWGRPGWRTGVRTPEEARATHAEIAECTDVLTFAGMEAYEGLAHSDNGAAEEARIVHDYLQDLLACGAEFATDNAGPLLLSAGGSGHLDLVCEALSAVSRDDWRILVRSGVYVAYDHGLYHNLAEQSTSRQTAQLFPSFRPALELWSCVQSVPDPGRALLTFGKRDCSYDAGLPVPLGPHQGARITRVDDQHAYLLCPDDMRPAIGEKVCCGISHPCTTFDKWRAIPLVDDEYTVLDIYRTFF